MKKLTTIILAFIAIHSLNAQTTTEISQFIANDAAANSYFGQSVSISGDYAVIGASITDGNVANSGAAYVFQFNAGTWTQVAKLTPSDGLADDYFGKSVDISGDYIIVGAYLNDGAAAQSGAAYIFEKPVSGWADMTETQKITASDGAYDDHYGLSVTIDGDYAAVGAERDDDAFSGSGSVYIYYRNTGTWTEQAKLNHGDPASSDYFGIAVSLEGDFLVAGAYGNNSWGAGYVFERSGTTWSQIAKLSTSDIAENDLLGYRVDISGDWIILGASGEDDAGENAGAAYLYKKPVTGWASGTETQKIVPTQLSTGDNYGISVTVNGESAVIGATHDSELGSNAGAAYLFQYNGTSWDEITKYLPSECLGWTYFGSSVSAEGDHILIGEPHNDDNGNVAGKTYYFSPTKIYITDQPTDISDACCDTDKLFIIKGGNIDNYQWQVSTDNGSIWSDITDNVIYTGSTNDTLTIHTEASLDGNQYRCYVSNTSYNETSNTATLTIESTPPNITSIHTDKTIGLDENCEAALPDYKSDVVANDNCDADLTITQNPTAGTAISGATNTITLRATDDAGNYDEVTFNVEVVDDTDPVITSTHESYAQPANENCLGILPDFTEDVVAYDNCDSELEIAQSPSPGSENGGSTVTLYVTDDAGNQTIVTFPTTIVDTTAPNITSTHSDLTIDADENCEAVVPNYTPSLWINDYCDPAPTKSQDPAPGTTISGAINTITLTAEDASGNTRSRSFNLAVIDNIAPTITSSHPNQTLYPLNGCDTLLPDYTTTITATDNCDPSLVYSQSPLAGATISGATNEVTLFAEDDDGNIGSITFNVEVADTIAPLITSTHNDINITSGPCEIALSDYTGDVTATDNCDTELTVTQNPIPGYIIGYEGNIVTLTVTDDFGNSDEVSFTVNIYDTEAPEITSTHNDVELEAGENCETELPDYRSSVVATDNCDNDLDIQQTPIFGTPISGVTNEVTLWATDNAGLIDEVTFNVAIVDNTGPIFTSTHDNQDIEAIENCEAPLPDYTVDAQVYDYCSDNITVTQSPEAGTTTTGGQVILTATDELNNATEVSFYVNVTDTTPPVITCPEDQVREAAEDGFYTVQSGEFIVIDTTDNCSGIMTIINDFNYAGYIEGVELTVGNLSITWTGQDNAGNSSTCSFNVQIDEYSGIPDFANSGIEVYPNPAKNKLIINSSQLKINKLIIKDLSGRTILIESINASQKEVNVESLSSGLYLIDFECDRRVYRTQLVIQ